MNEPPRIGLEDARRRLKELGYLNGRVERYVFGRALEGRGGLLLPAWLLGAFAAALACVAAAAAGEPGFFANPLSPVVLFLHLFAAFLLPGAALAIAVGAAAGAVRSPAPAALGLGVGAALSLFFLWIAGAYKLARDLSGGALLWGFPVAVAALVFARSLRSGFLARAYAHSRVLPRAHRNGALFGAAAAGLLVAAGVFAARGEPPSPPSLHLSPRSERVVVIAIDGVRDAELAPDGSLLGRALARGASGWWTLEASAPPELWTTLATGVPSGRHGVRALERVRPAGSASALRPPLGSAWYLKRVAPALGLASSAPVSAADRRALAFWEVSASAGLPSAAFGWWASGPWPGAEVVDNREILSRASSGEDADRIAIEEFSSHPQFAVSSVYLPGMDVLRGAPERRAREIAVVAAFVEAQSSRSSGGKAVVIVLTADSHAPSGARGRMTVFDGRDPTIVRIRPVDVAPSVLARAGIPPAEDLAGRPVPVLFRTGSLETLTVPTYGPRRQPPALSSPTSDRDYLKKLRSLGYLN